MRHAKEDLPAQRQTGPKTKETLHRCDREAIKGLQQSVQFERFCGAALQVEVHSTLSSRYLYLRIHTGFAAILPTSSCGDKKMKRSILTFLADESGATAIEYGLIAAGISLAIIAAVTTLGTTLSGVFTNVSSSLK
jgi:pilus assembly protein Flp/PilA